MARLSIKGKLLGTILGLSAFIVTAGAISSITSKSIENDYKKVVSGAFPKLKLASEMYLSYQNVRIQLRTLGIPNLSAKQTVDAVDQALTAIAQYEDANKSYLELEATPGQKEVYDAVSKAWSSFKTVSATALELQKSGTAENRLKLIDIFLKDCPASAASFAAAIHALKDFHQKEIQHDVAETETMSRHANLSTWAAIFFSVTLSLGLGLYVAFSTSRELKSITSELSVSSDQISGAASDLNETSETLSQSASNQAASIQETAASIDEIRAMVERNTENSAVSARLSAKSKEEAIAGRQSVRDMISAMNEINESNTNIKTEVTDGNRRIEEVVAIIQEIKSKANVINDIVFQTKLLSFNASVEAARAGEHGKGFAVVAEEVGNLATMSGNAATEISTLLESSSSKVTSIVQQTASRVGGLMDAAEAKVTRGNALANQCGEVLERIVSNADHLSEMVTSISSASQEQSSGIGEIAKAIRLLDEATQVNMAQTHQTAASASELGHQVDVLNQSSLRLKILVDGPRASEQAVTSSFIWKQKYSLGVDEMDHEHKILIEKINILIRAINENQKKSALLALYQDLCAYTAEHFADEENYMQSIDYPGYRGHKKIHETLLEQLARFESEFKKNDFNPAHLMTFFNDWLVHHIMGADMKYADHGRSRAGAA